MLQIINEHMGTYIGVLLLGIGEIVFAKVSLDKPITTNKFMTFVILILTALACTIISINMTGMTKTLSICIVHVFEFKLLFNLSYHKSIFLTFIYMTLIIGLELIQLLFATNIIGLSKDYCYNDFAGSFVGNVTTCISLLVITLVSKNILRKLTNAKLETNTKIIIYLILTFICSGIFLYNIVRDFKFSNDIVLYLISIIVLITVLLSLIKQMLDNSKLTQEYDKLLEFMTTYEVEIEKQRILRHEIKNEFRTIRAKICDKQKNKEIIEYIDEIVNDKYEIKQEQYAKFGYLPANGIKGLCYFKVQEAEEKGMKVALNISKKIKESSIYELNIKEQRDFGRILGVFLDNAIESSLESDKKQLGIEAYTNTNQDFKMIISNTYNNKIDKAKIGKESFSTKGKNRGHGLLLVKELVRKNKIFEINTTIQDDIYIQKIEIKKIIEPK